MCQLIRMTLEQEGVLQTFMGLCIFSAPNVLSILIEVLYIKHRNKLSLATD